MEAQIIFKQGAVRRVGNGTTISISNDPWLPNDDPYVHTDNAAIIGRNVDALMVPGQCAWDVDVVKDVFLERDAQLIISIPLREPDSDRWFWKWDKMGKYTVRSAYAAIQEGKQNIIQNGITPWKKLWNAKVPLKVKHFLWRAVQNVLPTKDQLLARRVEVDDKCPVCNEELETVYHAMVSCRVAKQCWDTLAFTIEETDTFSFDRWLSTSIQKCNTMELQEVFMLCWSLWKNRNEVVWNQRGGEFSDICKLAKILLNQWKNAQDKSFDNFLGFMTQEDGKERWEYPQEGRVKLNVDIAIFKNLNTYCLSMVARNHRGELVIARTSCREGIIAPDLAEALGIKEALSWIKSNLNQPVVLETDCLSVVQAIRCSSVHFSYLGRVIEECKFLLTELKNRPVALVFVKRSANIVAHFLARRNSSVADRVWSGECVYPELFYVLNKDLRR